MKNKKMMATLTCFVVAMAIVGCTSSKSPDTNKQKETTTESVTVESNLENSLTQNNNEQNKEDENQTSESLVRKNESQTSEGSIQKNENQTTEGLIQKNESQTSDNIKQEQNNQPSGESQTVASKESIGIKIEDIDSKADIADVYMDEVRYYAYKTQATYEVYYMSKNKELKWDKKLKIGATLEEGVKSQILSDICERQALYEEASKYDVSLSAEEESKANEEADYYLENSSEKMLSKVNISKERLVEIYKKEKIAKKVEDILNAKERHGADEMYQQWKGKVTIVMEEPWGEINFSEKIMEE